MKTLADIREYAIEHGYNGKNLKNALSDAEKYLDQNGCMTDEDFDFYTFFWLNAFDD